MSHNLISTLESLRNVVFRKADQTMIESRYLTATITFLTGNTCTFQVLHMDERFRYVLDEPTSPSLFEFNGINVYSYAEPSIEIKDGRLKSLYLHGSRKERDNKVVVKTAETKRQRNDWVTLIMSTLANFDKWEGFKEDRLGIPDMKRLAPKSTAYIQHLEERIQELRTSLEGIAKSSVVGGQDAVEALFKDEQLMERTELLRKKYEQ